MKFSLRSILIKTSSISLMVACLLQILFLNGNNIKPVDATKPSCSKTIDPWCTRSPQNNLLLSHYYGPRTSRNFDLMRTSEIFSVPITFNSLMRQHDRQVVQQMMNLSSNTPRYDILEDDRKFELAIDVPGVRLEDISVTLEEGGKLLKIGGFRRHHRQSYSLSSTNGKRQNYVDSSFKFDQMFTLDDTIVDIKNIEVTLSNGVLVVTVPKLVVDPNVKKDLVVQKIPIKVEYNQQDKHKEDNTLKEVQTEESGNRQNDQEYEHVVQSSFIPKNDDSDDLEISEEEDI